MDKKVWKYMLYKAKTLEDRRKELKELQARKEELRNDMIDSTGGLSLDGLPRGKGKVGNPTEQKAMKLMALDRRIDKLIEEIGVFRRYEESLKEPFLKEVYRETILKDVTSMTAKAQQLHIGRRQLIYLRAHMLTDIATEFGEYIEKE